MLLTMTDDPFAEKYADMRCAVFAAAGLNQPYVRGMDGKDQDI
jgi:hypothetical protein